MSDVFDDGDDEDDEEDGNNLPPSTSEQQKFIEGLYTVTGPLRPDQRARFMHLVKEEKTVESLYAFIYRTFDTIRADYTLCEFVQEPLEKTGDHYADVTKGNDIDYALSAYVMGASLLPSGSVQREKLEKKLEKIITQNEAALDDFLLFRAQTLFIESAYILNDNRRLDQWKDSWKENCDKMVAFFPENVEDIFNETILNADELPLWCYERAAEGLLGYMKAHLQHPSTSGAEEIMQHGPIWVAARVIPKLQADPAVETKYAVVFNNLLVALQWNAAAPTESSEEAVVVDDKEIVIQDDIQFIQMSLLDETIDESENRSILHGIIQVMNNIRSDSIAWKRDETEVEEKDPQIKIAHEKAARTVETTGKLMLKYALSAGADFENDVDETVSLMDDLFARFCAHQAAANKKKSKKKTTDYKRLMDVENRLKILELFSRNDSIHPLISDWASVRENQMNIVRIALMNVRTIAYTDQEIKGLNQKECEKVRPISGAKDIFINSPRSRYILN